MYQRILVAIDGSATATRALDEAVQLARQTGGTLCLMHVSDESHYATGFETGQAFFEDVVPFIKKSGNEILAAGRARTDGVPVETLLADGLGKSVAELVVIQARAWPAELIVVGTHGRHGIGRAVMGSDAESIVRRSPVPVLLVRTPE